MGGTIFDLETSRLKEEIIRKGARKVMIQLPEGLKPEGPRLASALEETGVTVILSGDPCYGACDLPLYDAESLGVDLIVHYGHTEMLPSEMTHVPLVYMESKANVNIKVAIRKALNELQPWKNLGLATTVQHANVLEDAKKILVDAGKTVHISKGEGTKYLGQVLGCNYNSAKAISRMVEAFLFVGGGRFHALGLFLATMKPTVVADPFENRAYSIDEAAQKVIRKRWANIEEAKTAQFFGVILGLKPGQSNIEAAVKIKEDLSRSGRKAVLLALREITPVTLQQFPEIDAFVNTACPRITLDDSPSFTKPVLNPKEAYVALRKKSWEELLENGLL